jgi:hypothetical protein
MRIKINKKRKRILFEFKGVIPIFLKRNRDKYKDKNKQSNI